MNRVYAALRPGHVIFLVLTYLAGLALIVIEPRGAAIFLILLLPFVALAVTISVAYMLYVYWRMPQPRPVFFRMLLESAVTKVAAGLSIGLIALASLGDRTGIFKLPLPGSPEQRAAYIALAILIALTPPIWYALVIASGRRAAGRSEFDSGDR